MYANFKFLKDTRISCVALSSRYGLIETIFWPRKPQLNLQIEQSGRQLANQ